mgnify:CR=1 FL=1
MEKVIIQTEFIKLEAALKYVNATPSGGMAKAAIQDGLVFVNDEVCTMRGKKLYAGDKIRYEDEEYIICNYDIKSN